MRRVGRATCICRRTSSGEGVDSRAQENITPSVTRDLIDDELVMVFRSVCRTKVDGGQEFEVNDR